MPKIGFLDVPSGLDLQYNASLTMGSRFGVSYVKAKKLFTSRSKLKGLTQKSLFVSLAPIYAGFSDSVKLAWSNAGKACGLNGFKLFVQDTSLRLANGLTGYSTPSTLHQAKCGEIQITAPATGLTLLQLHPQSYNVYKKVAGTRSQYVPVPVVEDLSMPVDIAISVKSDLVSAGSFPYARFFIIIYSNYQGLTKQNVCDIEIPLVHDWQRLTALISGVIGQFRGYTAFIQINDARGTLLFDNVEISHGGINWARDPFCNNISQEFTKAFQQIPDHWTPLSIVSGAFYHSNFPDAIPAFSYFLLLQNGGKIQKEDCGAILLS